MAHCGIREESKKLSRWKIKSIRGRSPVIVHFCVTSWVHNYNSLQSTSQSVNRSPPVWRVAFLPSKCSFYKVILSVENRENEVIAVPLWSTNPRHGRVIYINVAMVDGNSFNLVVNNCHVDSVWLGPSSKENRAGIMVNKLFDSFVLHLYCRIAAAHPKWRFENAIKVCHNERDCICDKN